MRWRTGHPLIRRLANGLMLLAALAFVKQSAMIGASQAAALAGSMPDPAVVLDGAIHFHDGLARHVHVHGGDTMPGHVHQAAHHDDHVHHAVHDDDDDDLDGPGQVVFWSLGCPAAVMPIIGTCAVPLEPVSAVGGALQDRPQGVEPDGLTRPPSTPSIA